MKTIGQLTTAMDYDKAIQWRLNESIFNVPVFDYAKKRKTLQNAFLEDSIPATNRRDNMTVESCTMSQRWISAASCVGASLLNNTSRILTLLKWEQNLTQRLKQFN